MKDCSFKPAIKAGHHVKPSMSTQPFKAKRKGGGKSSRSNNEHTFLDVNGEYDSSMIRDN